MLVYVYILRKQYLPPSPHAKGKEKFTPSNFDKSTLPEFVGAKNLPNITKKIREIQIFAVINSKREVLKILFFMSVIKVLNLFANLRTFTFYVFFSQFETLR